MSGAPGDAPDELEEELRRQLDEDAAGEGDDTSGSVAARMAESAGVDESTEEKTTGSVIPDTGGTGAVTDSAAPTDDEIPEGVDPADPGSEPAADAGDTDPAPGREGPPEGTNPAGPTGGPGRTAPDQDSQQRGGDSRLCRRPDSSRPACPKI